MPGFPYFLYPSLDFILSVRDNGLAKKAKYSSKVLKKERIL